MRSRPHFRAFPRRDITLTAHIAVATGLRSDARLLNVGLGGACVDLAEPLEVGQPVTLHVTTPVLWDPLVVHARVAWLDPEGGRARVGLEFDHARSRVIRALFELLEAEQFA
jgi:Tfp pilus assembly protein PilZ